MCDATGNERELVLCDGKNRECEVSCHIACMGMRKVPKRSWFCPQCTSTSGVSIPMFQRVYTKEDDTKGHCLHAACAFPHAAVLYAEKFLASGTELEIQQAVNESPSVLARVHQMYPRDSWVLDEKLRFNAFRGKQQQVLLDMLSYASHACAPNATILMDYKGRVATLTAKRSIDKDEEITISYFDSCVVAGSHSQRCKQIEKWGWKFTCKCDACRYKAPGSFLARCDPTLDGSLFTMIMSWKGRAAYTSKGEYFLYYDDAWWIGRSLGGSTDVYAFCDKRSFMPPSSGWLISDENGFIGRGRPNDPPTGLASPLTLTER